MPIYLDRDLSNHKTDPALRSIDIGLINNMPDGALKTTEHQFIRLLDSAAEGMLVRLSFYALPDVPRADSGRQHIRSFYSNIDTLWDRRLDGLIMTGCEPHASNLRDEPYWASMTKVIDWAEQNTTSAVWSCLAAHAAVLHCDGIARRRLDQKRCGVFEFSRLAAHPLTAGLSSLMAMPHSRWNDLPEDQLTSSGYRILTRSQAAGVDAFVKQGKSLFVYFQGHPEYEAETLLLEFSRDLKRYQRGESTTYPEMPQGFSNRDDPWRSAAQHMYRNWLAYLCARKNDQLRKRPDRESAALHRAASAD